MWWQCVYYCTKDNDTGRLSSGNHNLFYSRYLGQILPKSFKWINDDTNDNIGGNNDDK